VGKNKLIRFAENETFGNIFQPSFSEVFGIDYHMKGKWHAEYFKNTNPIVIELGCGKGEYTVGMARVNPDKNYIGFDIKGARLWRGAKTAVEENLGNVAFIRNRIENILSFFEPGEVSEIWITFPDPQLKSARALKRLTSSRFLNRYKQFLKPGGVVHLKTDSQELHEYTKSVLEHNSLKVNHCTNDLYNSNLPNPFLSIKTFYEQQFLEQGKTITYLNFELNRVDPIQEPPSEE